MKIVKRFNTMEGIPWSQIEFPPDTWCCSVCLRAKAARKNFQRPIPPRAKAYRPAQILSTDLIGKFEISDIFLDLVFFLTLVCHFSGYLWLRPLQHKGQAADELISLLRFIDKKWGGIEICRRDNDPALDSAKVQLELRTLGIEDGILGIGSAGSNGSIERQHYTVMDTTRSEMIQSGEPVAALPYALLHAAWVANRMPKRNGQVPFTILEGEKPDYALFHPFGAAGVVRILKPKSKVDPRAVSGRFYGMSNDSRTVYLVKVRTKDSAGKIAERVIPSKDFWFENDPQLPSGVHTYDYVESSWLPQYDAFGRELTTGKHHDTACRKCHEGGSALLECDYCDAIYHKKCTELGMRKLHKDEIFRCPSCRAQDEDTPAVVSLQHRRDAARQRNAELTAIRKQAALEARTKKLAAKALKNKEKKRNDDQARALHARQIAFSQQQKRKDKEWAEQAARGRTEELPDELPAGRCCALETLRDQ
jgi:hypothetical protein